MLHAMWHRCQRAGVPQLGFSADIVSLIPAHTPALGSYYGNAHLSTPANTLLPCPSSIKSDTLLP